MLGVGEGAREEIQSEAACLRECVASSALLALPFTTVDEYLELLQQVAQVVESHGKHVMFFLAAAVSDFYIPGSATHEPHETLS